MNHLAWGHGKKAKAAGVYFKTAHDSANVINWVNDDGLGGSQNGGAWMDQYM